MEHIKYALIITDAPQDILIIAIALFGMYEASQNEKFSLTLINKKMARVPSTELNLI